MNELFIRSLEQRDLQEIVARFSFPWDTKEKTKKTWDTYFLEQKEGNRTVVVIEESSVIIGYGSLLRKSENSQFFQENIPEINAIWIEESRRNLGYGRALIHWIEELAKKEGYNQIGIGVGLYKDCGPAQRLYFSMGYIPNGQGVTYKCAQGMPGEKYPLDDDLILWLSKPLREENG